MGCFLEDENDLSTIKQLVRAYFDIVKRNLVDYIPKTIITLLVNESCQICDRDLIIRLYDESKFDTILQMDETLVQKLKTTEQDYQSLIECKGILENFNSSDLGVSRSFGYGNDSYMEPSQDLDNPFA